jgi:hypothetical protein
MQEIKIGGIYKHYKGNKYKVLSLGKHSETLEELVIYECLYVNPKGKIWARPREMFFENITKDGKTFPRFELLPE